MKLDIETFSNVKGGNSFYKAVTHPLAARAVPGLLRRLGGRRLALYDPLGLAGGFAEFYDLAALDLVGCFVQDVSAIGKPVLGRAAVPVTELRESGAEAVLVVGIDKLPLVMLMFLDGRPCRINFVNVFGIRCGVQEREYVSTVVVLLLLKPMTTPWCVLLAMMLPARSVSIERPAPSFSSERSSIFRPRVVPLFAFSRSSLRSDLFIAGT